VESRHKLVPRFDRADVIVDPVGDCSDLTLDTVNPGSLGGFGSLIIPLEDCVREFINGSWFNVGAAVEKG
jgi:hypothetical protein